MNILHGPALWYVTRATGLVSLVMLTVTVLLGLLVTGNFTGARWPRYLTRGLHQTVSMVVLVFLALHIAATVVDTYTSISLTAAFIPFASSYKAAWLSLGAIALDHRPFGHLGHRADAGLRRLRRRRGGLARAHDRRTVNQLLAPRRVIPRLLAGLSYDGPAGLAEHYRQYGPLPMVTRRFVDVVDASGLTGRGGAGFPTGRKMRIVADGGDTPVVVANGCEGEPASSKDRLLLTMLPHLVLDGIVAAAQAVGTADAHLCVHDHEAALLERLEYAVAERADPVRIRVAGVPGRYVASEQSALVQFLNGGPAKPTYSPPRPQERGVRGRPTLVNNVETLAHLALIARYGDRWFRSAGLPAAPGSMLVTVSGAVGRPGIYEIELGTPIGDVVTRAGGHTELPQALLVGGYFGAWLDAEAAWRLPMTHAALKAAGGALGAGMVIARPESSCLIAETARVVRYLAGEGAGQCGPCVFGLPALADALADLAYHGGRGRALDQLARLIPLVERRGACKHPDGVTQLITSALRVAAGDARRHDAAGPCPAIVREPLLPLPVED